MCSFYTICSLQPFLAAELLACLGVYARYSCWRGSWRNAIRSRCKVDAKRMRNGCEADANRMRSGCEMSTSQGGNLPTPSKFKAELGHIKLLSFDAADLGWRYIFFYPRSRWIHSSNAPPLHPLPKPVKEIHEPPTPISLLHDRELAACELQGDDSSPVRAFSICMSTNVSNFLTFDTVQH